MKKFTMIKIGYTYSPNSGCSGEYFTAICLNGKQYNTFTFYGLYGAEDRIRGELTRKGYDFFYTTSVYGQLKRDDIPKRYVMSEYEATAYIKNGFKRSHKATGKCPTWGEPILPDNDGNCSQCGDKLI